ncbi:coenzyme F420-0:L-glutamate ligase [Candidatus Uhrbacteria bacterium]|nr:coenzyme F420-0:L-glutamate ligase [Candidatus Uhrbacteria bacterium]
MTITPVKTRIFFERENLCVFIKEHIPTISEQTVLVVTSKIVALAQGRTHADPSNRDRLIKEESEFALQTEHTWLTIKDGAVMASAGIDESNADGKLILLPHNSFVSAWHIREWARKNYGISDLGVLITDSRLLPLRAGVVGIALGYAGFEGIRDYRGTPDLFGRPLQITRTDVADALAAAAVLEMGEGSECRPLALITRPRVKFTDAASNESELKIAPRDDIYYPFFRALV